MIRNFVRLAGTPENSKRRTTRRSGNALTSTRRRNPQIRQGGIEIGAFDPVVGVGHSPLAERVDHRAQALASGREAILMPVAAGTRPVFDDTVVL